MKCGKRASTSCLRLLTITSCESGMPTARMSRMLRLLPRSPCPRASSQTSWKNSKKNFGRQRENINEKQNEYENGAKPVNCTLPDSYEEPPNSAWLPCAEVKEIMSVVF